VVAVVAKFKIEGIGNGSIHARGNIVNRPAVRIAFDHFKVCLQDSIIKGRRDLANSSAQAGNKGMAG